MDAAEIQAKATIASALILSRAVELPTAPRDANVPDEVALRLRELTNYLYAVLTRDV